MVAFMDFARSAYCPYFFTSISLILGFLMYFYAPYWRVRKFPGPPAAPLLGHLPLLTKYGPDVFTALAEKYRPIFRFHMGRQPLVIIADPELCREAGIKKFKYFRNRSISTPMSASPLHQKGLSFTRDSRWSIMRNTLIFAYQPAQLASLIPTIQSAIESATENLPEKCKYINFHGISLKLATDIIGLAEFGVDFGLSKDRVVDNAKDDEVTRFMNKHMYSTTSLKMDLSGSISIIVGLLLPILQEPLRQILRLIPGTADRKMDQTNNSLCRLLDEIVAKRMEDEGRGMSYKDFLSVVLNAKESNRVSEDIFTPDYISALSYEHLLGGSATVSFTLASILDLVSAHEDVERSCLRKLMLSSPVMLFLQQKIRNLH